MQNQSQPHGNKKKQDPHQMDFLSPVSCCEKLETTLPQQPVVPPGQTQLFLPMCINGETIFHRRACFQMSFPKQHRLSCFCRCDPTGNGKNLWPQHSIQARSERQEHMQNSGSVHHLSFF